MSPLYIVKEGAIGALMLGVLLGHSFFEKALLVVLAAVIPPITKAAIDWIRNRKNGTPTKD